MPPKKNPLRGRGRPRKLAKNSEEPHTNGNEPSQNGLTSRKSGPQRSRDGLPGIKYIPLRHNFSSDESDDSVNPSIRSSQPQSMLGLHNTLKQLLSAGNGPSTEPSVSLKTPTKRMDAPRPHATGASGDSPINLASTPISRLKRVAAQLNSPDSWAPSPAHFHDVTEGLPRPKRSRNAPQAAKPKRGPGRPPKLAQEKNRTMKKAAGAVSQSPESPDLNHGPKETPESLEASRHQSRPDPRAYSEQVSHHLVDLTADDSGDFVGSNRRRSSYNNRGKRQLSVGNGFSSKPHAEVSAEEYYKLLDPSMPEPNQMRQLLTWCFKKSLESNEDPDVLVSKDADTAKGIAKIIKQELLADLAKGTISTSWYSMKDLPTELAGKRVIKPNPLNESNKESIEVFKRKLRLLELEKLQWREALDSHLRRIVGLTAISKRIGNHGKDNKQQDQQAGGMEDSGESKARDPTRESEELHVGADTNNAPCADMSALREYLQHRKGGKDILDQVFGDPNSSLVDRLENATKNSEEMLRNTLPSNMDQLFHILYQLKQSLGLLSRVKLDLLSAQVAKLVKSFMDRNEKTEKWSHLSTRNLMKGIALLDLSRRKT